MYHLLIINTYQTSAEPPAALGRYCNIIIASNTQNALQILLQQPIDLIISHDAAAAQDTLLFAAKLRSLNRHIPHFLCLSQFSEVIEIAAKHLGITPFNNSDYQTEEMQKAILQHFGLPCNHLTPIKKGEPLSPPPFSYSEDV